jgi:hypothetical protein
MAIIAFTGPIQTILFIRTLLASFSSVKRFRERNVQLYADRPAEEPQSGKQNENRDGYRRSGHSVCTYFQRKELDGFKPS